MKKGVQTVFKRQEQKYKITQAQYAALEPALCSHMCPDEHGVYTICNVYLDTAQNDLIRRSVEKPVFKEKMRLRSYGIPGKEDPVFLEIKRKFKGEVYKRRVVLPYAAAQQYLRDGICTGKQSQIFSEMDYFIRLYHPVPKMYIAYDRTAFCSPTDAGLRVTVDRNIRYRQESLSLSDGDRGELLLPQDVCIMEIKTDSAMPLWLSRALAGQGIYPTSFSKYGSIYQKTQQDKRR